MENPEVTTQTTETTAKKGKDPVFVAPKEASVTGELLTIAELEEKGVALIYVQDADDTVVVVSTSIAYWKKVGKFFNAGNIVKIGYEKRIEDVTNYKDQAGNVKTHTSSGLNILSVTPYSVSAWNKAKAAEKQASDMIQITAQDPSLVGAVSSYLATTYSAALKG